MVIRGGSAGGYTTLCALTFTDVFAAGASHYGVADLGALATTPTSSRPATSTGWWVRGRTRRRCTKSAHRSSHRPGSTPLILFQGLEDKVVPPEQSEMMVDALRNKGVPFAYVTYEGEQHGFRKAENIKRTAQAELSFYGAILGFQPADAIDPSPPTGSRQPDGRVRTGGHDRSPGGRGRAVVLPAGILGFEPADAIDPVPIELVTSPVGTDPSPVGAPANW